jgi:hypothetical protein
MSMSILGGTQRQQSFRFVQHPPFIQAHRGVGVARGQVLNKPKR